MMSVVSTTDADWQLEAYVVNEGAFNSQKGFVHVWSGGILLHHGGSPQIISFRCCSKSGSRTLLTPSCSIS